MSGIDLDEKLLRSEKEAEAYIKWYLRVSVHDIQDEFESDKDRESFLKRREKHFSIQLDELSNVSFSSAIPCPQEKQKWFKIVREIHKDTPLSSKGSHIRSSRFNFKNADKLLNRVIYFGETKEVCFSELFHLDIQKNNYNALAEIPKKFRAVQFKFPKCNIYEYEVSLNNILVLTSEPSYKAAGISDRVVKNEWFSINNEFEIPTASQILGTLAKNKGYNGILFASTRSQTKRNLVIFEKNTGELKDYDGIKELNRFPLDPEQF